MQKNLKEMTEIHSSWRKLLSYETVQHSNGNKNEDEIPQCGSERTIRLHGKNTIIWCWPWSLRLKRDGVSKNAFYRCVCFLSVFYLQRSIFPYERNVNVLMCMWCKWSYVIVVILFWLKSSSFRCLAQC